MHWMTRTISATAVAAVLTSGPVIRKVHAAPEQSTTKSTTQRPPAVPLVMSDPYFSIWSTANSLSTLETRHWTGKPHRLTLLVRIDGKTYRLMGDAPDEVAALRQSALHVFPTQTVYEFETGGVKITLTFTSPMLPDDLMVLSRPVTYITWSAASIDGKPHDTAVYFDAASEIAVNTPDQTVITGRQKVGTLDVLSVGSEDQNVLLTSGDDRRIDWGHLYVVADGAKAKSTLAPAAAARAAFGSGSEFPADAATQPVKASEAPVLAISMPLGNVAGEAVSGHVTLAYDDEVSIKYFRTSLKPYWRKDGATATDLITAAEKDYQSLLNRCSAFDAELMADLNKIGGESYAQLGALAWRQALAAQKLCADANGQPLSFSKENFSNGCIATVDVLYPASPQMVIFAPSLLKASLVPILDYSASPLWKDDSAPHDLGTYPLAIGQVYGGGEKSPMPVEETGNMLIMLGALAKTEGNADFAGKYWPVLTTWTNYLKKNGLDPANQLCTDDFAGHIARNANLSAKGIVGIASYGMLADMLGKKEVAEESMKTARAYARKWMEMADAGDHYQLVFGEEGKDTWSQKYNIAWDKLLDLNVFPDEVIEKEIAFYRNKMNRYGLPLDSRKTYTKLDWQLWTATMTRDPADFQMIVDACARWANETNARVPMTDWYETESGKQSGFQARSVVGGLYIGLMRDKAIWHKYAARDTAKPGQWAEINYKMPPMRKLLATADTAPATWKYTTETPDAKWMDSSFDDGSWKSGKSGFGTKGTPGAVIHTPWDTSDIYLRREFDLPTGELHDPQLFIHHDDDVEVYVNGVLATRAQGFLTTYSARPMSKSARAALLPGQKNVIAVHCRQHGGGQFIDVGLVDVLPMPNP